MCEVEYHLLEYKGGTIMIRFELIDRKYVKIGQIDTNVGINIVNDNIPINEVFQYIKFNVWESYMNWLNELNNKDLIDVE